MQSELWRRLPRPLKSAFRASNPEKGKELDTDQMLEDRQEQKSSRDQNIAFINDRQKQLERRPK